MMGNQKWFEAGSELADAHQELLNFEKNFKPELEAKKREFDALDDRAEKLSGKLAQAIVDLDQKKAVIMDGLETAKEFSSGAETIHGHALACLRLERDLAEIQMKKFQLGGWPLEMRRQAARKFFLAMIQVGGITVNFQFANSGQGQAEAWSAKMEALEKRIAIMQGEAEKFKPLKFTANSANEIICMAAMLPKADLFKLVQAWSESVSENAKKIMLTYTPDGILGWRITRPRPEVKTMTSHELQDYDTAGSSQSRYGRIRL